MDRLIKLGVVVCLLTFCPVMRAKTADVNKPRADSSVAEEALEVAAAETADANKLRTDLEAAKGDTQWFRDAKFGLMVHVGPYNLIEKEASWSRGGPRAGFKHGLKPNGKYTPVDVYDNLFKKYDPAKFDANQWVQITKDAGAKYFVFTTKHHDGFVNFDSKLTDYKITSPESPFGRDMVKELADVCHKQDMRLGLYYSQPDWHNPDAFTANHDRYIKYLHGQLRELCTNYGKVDVIWFDGLLYSPKDWDAANLAKMIRSLQPHVLINNRIVYPYGAEGIRCDFDTPEGQIGAFQNERPWETVMPITRGWGWSSKDTPMSLEQCKKILLYVVGSDGNFLLNVGVMPNGQIDPNQVLRIKEIGQWLQKYGQSIYSTRGGPYKPGLWGVSTNKGNTIYLHVMDWKEPARFPLSGCKIVSSEVLTGGSVKVEQTEKYFSVNVTPEKRDNLDTIIKLELSNPASLIAPCNTQYSSLIPYKSVSSYPKPSAKWKTSDPNRALDNDCSTHWETPPGGWIEVDLGKAVSINRIAVCEGRPVFRSAVKNFEIQYKNDGEWRTITKGEKMGFDYSTSFEPVSARYVRLNFIKSGRVVVRELYIFGPAK